MNCMCSLRASVGDLKEFMCNLKGLVVLGLEAVLFGMEAAMEIPQVSSDGLLARISLCAYV